MTIEMNRPEDLFSDPEMVAIAKGASVAETRKTMKDNLKHNEPIEGDIRNVNTFSRLELMKTKTRELTAMCKDQSFLDTFDLLAMDWVYSDQLFWEGSMAEAHMKKILSTVL